MKIKLIVVGGLKQKYAQEGCELFVKRLKHLCKFELIEVRDAKRKGKDVSRWKDEEATRLMQALDSVTDWIVLDERGKHYHSKAFAQLIQNSQNRACQSLAFVIGGPDGLAHEILQKAPRAMCLGAMTMPHELARLVLLEQLYRAHCILANTPYHRD